MTDANRHRSSIRTYENNRNKNGAPALDPADDRVIENIYELGVTTPGYIRLAVCGRRRGVGEQGKQQRIHHISMR
jgi:hypothetical protein